MNGSLEAVRSWLGWPHEELPRLEALAAGGALKRNMPMPTGEALTAMLERLDCPAHAVEEIGDGALAAMSNAESRWLLERLYKQLAELDGAAIAPPWPAPEPGDDPVSRYFHLYVFLAAVPEVLRIHAARGIAEEVTWSTLRDVGLQVANYQTREGRPGFDGAFWIWQHFRGDTFRLGRLQYDLTLVDFDPADDPPFSRSDPGIGVHIPAAGPLTPEACDDSIDRARAFFPRHFPEVSCRVAVCRSWLLDPQLAHYLPQDSNIVRFQRRFTPVPGRARPGDDDTVRFVFGGLPASLDDLPQRTTLERAIVRHLREGGHWRICLGWFAL